jgi:6-phosphogluconolactonase (cycloisomerase 2 family)
LKEIEQAVSAPAGSSDYNGYFKLSAEGTKIYVNDGADSESTVAGYTIAGNNRIAVAIANFTVAVSGVVYIKTTWNGSAFVSVLLNASQLPIASNGIDIKLVGEYNFSSGAASIISQRLQGENLITGRIC